MADTVRVQVLFTEDTDYGQFTDALYFTQDEYALLLPNDIEAMKQSRIDNWIAVITMPSPDISDDNLVE